MKRFFREYKFVWISYLVIILLMSLDRLIPDDNSIIWLWFWAFYVPFVCCGVYLYAFILGILIQRKLAGSFKQTVLHTILYLVLISIPLFLQKIESLMFHGVLYYIESTVIPVVFSSLCFLFGEVIVNVVRAIKEKRKK